MSFYNTIELAGDQLTQARTQVRSQEDRILALFQRYRLSWTPADVLVYMPARTPITSVRRAMTNLTAKGLLKKIPLSEKTRVGYYGKPVHSWTLS